MGFLWNLVILNGMFWSGFWKPPCFVLQNEFGVMQPTGIKDYASCTKEMAGNILQARVGAAVAVHKRLDYCDSGNRMRG